MQRSEQEVHKYVRCDFYSVLTKQCGNARYTRDRHRRQSEVRLNTVKPVDKLEQCGRIKKGEKERATTKSRATKCGYV